MKRALLLTLNELKLFLIDKTDLAFSLLLPITVFALMYFGFSGNMSFNATASIVNQDEGGFYAERLLEQLDAVEGIDIRYYTEEDAENRLSRSDILMVLYIPEGFSEHLRAGEPAELVFRQRGNGGQANQIISSIVGGIASEINLELQAYSQVSGMLEDSGIGKAAIETVVKKYLDEEDAEPVVSISQRTVGSSPDPINQYLPGVVNMFVLFSISLSARMIIEEKKRGTFERLLTTRLTVGEMYAGKFLSGITRGFVQTLVLLLLAYAVFQMFTPLSFLQCLLIALVFAGAATGIGMLIATVARSGDAATWIAVFFTMAMVMIGGTFFEVAKDSVLYTIGRFSLVTYANDAFRTIIAEGGSLGDIGRDIGILAAVMVVGLSVSRILFNRMPGGK